MRARRGLDVMLSRCDVQRNPGAEEKSPVKRRPIIPNAERLRASVGSTDASASLLAREGAGSLPEFEAISESGGIT
jgi:hypothetical protein